jgi:D-alanyl-D-alanine carboxypeptidase
MKITYSIIAVCFLFTACRKVEVIEANFYQCNLEFEDSSALNPDTDNFQNILQTMTDNGVVGVQMSVMNENGMWLGASGKADIYNDVNMLPCNKTRVGSTVKMFTATIILKLQEEGKLDIQQPIADYLNNEHISKIPNADKATIFQLLQHSSGIYNYIQNLQFQTASLNDLLKSWSADELLQYADGKAAYFEPGADVSYSNTNYILLGLLIEQIEGKPLYQVFNEKIISPLNLQNTMFAGENPVPDGIVRGYIDVYSNLEVIESTYYSGWDYFTADGGLISNVYDMNVFFRALMSGAIINTASLDQMISWQAPKSFELSILEIAYGLGIFKMETERGACYFHSGDAIGYYANMMYFPEDGTTIVYAVNSNYGKIDQFVSSANAMRDIILVTKN